MDLKSIILKIINEDVLDSSILKTTSTKPIANAIKGRNLITFYYSGPRKPKKDSVKAGNRYQVEPYEIGLSKKGNLILRGFVSNPSSTTKTGFQKGQWRTFIMSRMRNTNISDETFEVRDSYKDVNSDAVMTKKYIKVDKNGKTPDKVVKKEKPKKVEPITPEKIGPTKKELPQPKPEVKPEKIEPTKKELPQPKPEVKPEKVEPEVITKKIEEPSIDKEKVELPQPKPEEKPKETPEDEENKNLQESIKKIKHLMFF